MLWPEQLKQILDKHKPRQQAITLKEYLCQGCRFANKDGLKLMQAIEILKGFCDYSLGLFAAK